MTLLVCLHMKKYNRLWPGLYADLCTEVHKTYQAGPGRAGKQQQEQTSPNLERTILYTSVLLKYAS